MSINRYYELLDSDEMSAIIKELWHGSNSKNFGLFGSSMNYKILRAGYDAEESRRLFKNQKSDMKTYMF